MTTTLDDTADHDTAPGGAARRAAARLPRLLPQAPEDLQAHLSRYGTVPYRASGGGSARGADARGAAGTLIADVEAAGLTGRGGAAFPVHRKLAAVAQAKGTRKVAVANGAES